MQDKNPILRQRLAPEDEYIDMPCSIVSVGCAMKKARMDVKPEEMLKKEKEALREDGYLTLDGMNRFIRQMLPVRKKAYYKRNERVRLEEFLRGNKEKCIVCVLGHYVYAENDLYWSFFENLEDQVVCVWYLNPD